MAVTPDYANLYVANEGTSSSAGSVVHYSIGLNGQLTAKDTLVLKRQSRFPDSEFRRNLSLCGFLHQHCHDSGADLREPGESTEYPLSSGAIGSEASQSPLSLSSVSDGYATDVIVPTGITVLANSAPDITGNAVYVSAYDQSAYNPGGSTTSTANPGWVFGFTIGSGGALTATSNSPYQAGIKPTAIASDPTDRFVYATDYASNELIGYTIQDGSTLNFMPSGPFKTGNEPSAIVIDPRGSFIYVTNALDSTVSAYAITQTTGIPRPQ